MNNILNNMLVWNGCRIVQITKSECLYTEKNKHLFDYECSNFVRHSVDATVISATFGITVAALAIILAIVFVVIRRRYKCFKKQGTFCYLPLTSIKENKPTDHVRITLLRLKLNLFVKNKNLSVKYIPWKLWTIIVDKRYSNYHLCATMNAFHFWL